MFKDGFERREALLKEGEKIVVEINSLDTKLADVKFLYEQYFIGMEKKEPFKLRKEVQDIIKVLTRTYIKSTVQKFRFHALIAKYATYSRLWDRILREIEEGTYKRDIFRIKVKEWQDNKKIKREKEKETIAAGKADPLQQLFDQYIETRKKSNESINNISKEKFAETITSQVSEIKKKFKCKSVSFKVIIEDGKTKLKAVPKN